MYKTLANKNLKAIQIPQPTNSQSKAVNKCSCCYGITTAAVKQQLDGSGDVVTNRAVLRQYVISMFSLNISSLLHVLYEMMHKEGMVEFGQKLFYSLVLALATASARSSGRRHSMGHWMFWKNEEEYVIYCKEIFICIFAIWNAGMIEGWYSPPFGQCLSGQASAGQSLSQHQAFCSSHSANPEEQHIIKLKFKLF